MFISFCEKNVFLLLQEVEKRFPDGLPLLDPIEDMGIKDRTLGDTIKVGKSSVLFDYMVIVNYSFCHQSAILLDSFVIIN